MERERLNTEQTERRNSAVRFNLDKHFHSVDPNGAESQCACDSYTSGYAHAKSDAAAEIDALRAKLADREAELLRVRTSENAAAHALDGLRISHTTLCPYAHPSEVAGALLATLVRVAGERDGCRGNGPHSREALMRSLDLAHDHQAHLIRERDAALADCKVLAAECEATRRRTLALDLGCMEEIIALRAATDASGALSRHADAKGGA